VRRRIGLAVLVALIGAIFHHGSVAADDAVPIDLGPGIECYGAVPHLPADPSRGTIRADIVVARDGVSEANARRVMKRAAQAYVKAPEGEASPDVKLNIIAVHNLTGELEGQVVNNEFVVDDNPRGTDLMSQLIRYYRAKYPRLRRDHVHLLTSTNIRLGLPPDPFGITSGVLGIANCIGSIGTKYSYSISEYGTSEPFTFGVKFSTDIDAKVAAHEIGHAFGAQHHYANCVERAAPSLNDRRADICTLMYNDASTVDLHFGTLEAAVVRGFAEAELDN
jgi:hypothetical protein